MPHRDDAKFLEVFRSQLSKNLPVDRILAKRGLVLTEVEHSQPIADVHGRFPSKTQQSWSVGRRLSIGPFSGNEAVSAIQATLVDIPLGAIFPSRSANDGSWRCCPVAPTPAFGCSPPVPG